MTGRAERAPHADTIGRIAASTRLHATRDKRRITRVGTGTVIARHASSVSGSCESANGNGRQAAEQAHWSKIGDTVRWRNDRTGDSGSVTPIRQGYDRSGRYCREYQQTITVSGRSETAYGTACLQPDGSWRIVDGPVDWRRY